MQKHSLPAVAGSKPFLSLSLIYSWSYVRELKRCINPLVQTKYAATGRPSNLPIVPLHLPYEQKQLLGSDLQLK